ncbi:facilitated trehalose transporter Tret1-2 homolog [Pseudomyrmex gracilis]|uniref:facilitated trehalose transporter Tret1-2 homolog n=1 Tax=Pseudomyrmex gracilis TaxID=219809 RepID=UPI000995625F|nr:facilitated trehalose transporter Tret1-2 homolog [Pseudomyrmex gracilis]
MMKIYECRVSDAKIKFYLRQLLTALGPLMGISVAGMVGSYSAILLPQLKTISTSGYANVTEITDNFGTLTVDQESWIASSSILPMIPGCWIAGFLVERFGRKTTLLLLFPVLMVAWFLIGFANSVEVLIAGRVLTGFCSGVQAPIYPIYVSETTDPRLRGILLGAINITLSIGVLGCHAIGTWFDWRTTAYICAGMPAICWCLCIFARESPMWLLNRGKIEEARRTWTHLRGERALDEFSLLETTRLTELSAKKKRSILRSLKKTWSSRYFLRPLGIVCVYFFISQFVGTNVMSFYAIHVLSNLSGSTHAYLIMLVIDSIRLTLAVVMCFLLKMCRRRVLTFISGFGVAVVMLSLSACLAHDVGRPWLSVVLLLTYVGMPPLGLTAVSWLLCGELFPREYRGLGSGLTSSFNFVCQFALIKMTPATIQIAGLEGTFALFGIVALVGTTVLYFILPETKNKTLQDIHMSFGKTSGLQKAAVSFHVDEKEKPESEDEAQEKTFDE